MTKTKDAGRFPANEDLRSEVHAHVHPARILAEIFLYLARRHRHPRERALLVEYMMAADGLDLAYTVRVRRDRVTADLARLARRLDELAKAMPKATAKGGGE
jgi:hypothetical protein